jgi:hypothetical protein
VARRWLLVLVIATLPGCVHRIAFEDLRYPVETPKQDMTLIAVIDQATIDRTVSLRSFMAGAAHEWVAEPGVMLKQVADVELPQVASSYQTATEYRDVPEGLPGATLVLEVPAYAFWDFHAAVTVRARAYRAGKELVFDHSYSETGDTQGGKVFWGGAFAMKSAIRQSSLDAYRKAFTKLRSDLQPVATRRAAER